MRVPGRPVRAAWSGFTLFELVLTVSLILLLAGGVIFGWDSLQRGARLDEGSDQVEMLFRFARAQAATSGRQVRVRVGPSGILPGSVSGPVSGTNAPIPSMPTPPAAGLEVLWEPDPLKRPGIFEPLPGVEGFRERIEELIKIQPHVLANPQRPQVEIPNSDGGASRNPTAGDSVGVLGSDPAEASMLQITFYPDGSSDSADWILGSKDPEDGRRLRLRLSGLTGTTRREWLERPDLAAMSPSESSATTTDSSVNGDSPQKTNP